MAEQNFKNHARLHPVYHFVLMPILLVNVLVALYFLVRHATFLRGWTLVMAIAFVLLGNLVRTYALKVQDRVIRLEERIRMAALMPMEARALQAELTTGQIVALRFASDGELAALAERAAREGLAPKAIKQLIQQWRPDTHRV